MIFWLIPRNNCRPFNTLPMDLSNWFNRSVVMQLALHAAEWRPPIHCVEEVCVGSSNYMGSSRWIGDVRKKMQPCYFWISVRRFAFCTFNERRLSLLIIKHIMDHKQCKAAMTSCINRIASQLSIFSALIREATCLFYGSPVFLRRIYLHFSVCCYAFDNTNVLSFSFHTMNLDFI